VPAHIGKPPYAASGVLPPWQSEQVHNEEVSSALCAAHCSLLLGTAGLIRTTQGIKRMRASGKLAAQVRQQILRLGVVPSPLELIPIPYPLSLTST
jgi:hypothetical protein